MNYRKIKTYIILMAVIAALVIPSTVLAKGNVTYKGQADKIVFEPGTKHSPTSLFENFENVMPGDSLTETVEVKNNSAEGKEIKVYMKALGADSGSEDFLSQLTLEVDKVGSGKLFDAKASETTGLDDWTLLGTLANGGKQTLDVTLGVPLSMGNDYQNREGTFKWQFKVEEIDPEGKPDKPDKPDDPPAGKPDDPPSDDSTDDPPSDTPVDDPGVDDNDGTDGTEKVAKTTKKTEKKGLASVVTGDTAAISVALIVMVLAAVVLAASLRKRKKS